MIAQATSKLDSDIDSGDVLEINAIGRLLNIEVLNISIGLYRADITRIRSSWQPVRIAHAAECVFVVAHSELNIQSTRNRDNILAYNAVIRKVKQKSM